VGWNDSSGVSSCLRGAALTGTQLYFYPLPPGDGENYSAGGADFSWSFISFL